MVFAQNAPGEITGIDIFPAFIDLFNQNARKLVLQDRVKGIVKSMDDLPFKDEELDLIWSKGAIYNIGFERGLNEWRKFLKTGGYIPVSRLGTSPTMVSTGCWPWRLGNFMLASLLESIRPF